MRNFKNPNILQPDSSVQTDDFSFVRFATLKCPHCRSLGSFSRGWGSIKYRKESRSVTGGGYHKEPIALSIRQCPNKSCNGLVMLLMLGEDADSCELTSYPPMMLDFDEEGLPAKLVKTLTEAIKCQAIGAFRASAMMVRRLLEEICEDAGSEGANLHLRLEALRDKMTLSDDLFEAMKELKALGNDAAHIEAKAYEAIEREDAELSIALAKEILKARYQHKELVDRLRARKKTKN